MALVYPERASERDAWILSQRPARNPTDPRIPYAFFNEPERSATGEIVPVSTVFLTNRECPWRCLMCDLWKNTLPGPVGLGDIPAQIDHALERLPPAEQIKLYNSGSFFDRGAIPPEDYQAIASRLRRFPHAIVESHPALVGDATLRCRDLLHGTLEVAMGLETADEEVLGKLNKRMTLAQFEAAAGVLRRAGVALRVFVLVKPPFTSEAGALHWAKRSIDFAFDAGAAVVSLIPVRAGNGAVDRLEAAGHFSPPRLATLEAALSYGLNTGRGRVFADLWEPRVTGSCPDCNQSRLARLAQMNLAQQELPATALCPCQFNTTSPS